RLQYFFIDPDQHLLDRSPRAHILLLDLSPPGLHRRQPLSIDLAVLRERHLVQNPDRLRDHIFEQSLSNVPLQQRGRQAFFPPHHPTAPLAAPPLPSSTATTAPAVTET